MDEWADLWDDEWGDVPEVTVGFAGAGSLTATVQPAVTVTAVFGGVGVLGAVVEVGGSVGVGAGFGGTGTLTATVQPVVTVTAVFGGAGTFTATVALPTGHEPFPDIRTLTLTAPTRSLTINAPTRTLEWSPR